MLSWRMPQACMRCARRLWAAGGCSPCPSRGGVRGKGEGTVGLWGGISNRAVG